ncbi:MAG: flagellar basal-body rod protein FlgF [bacterium]|nr:MAG: flagellar basal-body rod protein FlgF [bacterium]
MENAAYVGLSRQMTLRRELDIVANNIANADTTGFKVEQLLLGAEIGERARNAFVRPGVSFVLDNGIGRDYGQGSLEQTGRNLDFAIEGEGAFFTLDDGAGEAYTRDGAFTLDRALGEPSVAADGTISQNGNPVGRLSIVRFDALAALEKGGDGLYRNASNATAIEAADAQVRQGMLEGSNVNPILEITNLIEIQRAYESVTRMIENTNDLSRRAVERLGRA